MDYKEKYKKAIEAVKKLQETNPSDEGIKNWVNDNFPELQESEDERIRKTLIEYFNAYPKDYYGELKKSHILAWLEKQRVGNFDNGYKVGFSAAKHNQWKPSDEQMRILSIYADQNNTHGAVLTSLYQDLKKLKG